jgi:hypothetical protein
MTDYDPTLGGPVNAHDVRLANPADPHSPIVITEITPAVQRFARAMMELINGDGDVVVVRSKCPGDATPPPHSDPGKAST